MKKFSFKLFLVIFLGLLTACISKKNIHQAQKSNDKKNTIDLAINNYLSTNDSIKVIPNQEGNLILYLTETIESPGNPVKDIRFFIYENASNSVIYKNNFSNAKIKWLSNTQLILTRSYGILDQPNGTNIKYHIINVLTGDINEYNKSIIKQH